MNPMNFCLIALFAVACGSPSADKSEGDRSSDQKHEKAISENSDTMSITETYWKLVKLEGQEIKMADNQEKEMTFTLHTDENRLAGFSGCNTFFGTYTLEDGMRIKFDHIGATKKACPDVMVDEQAFLSIFGLADNYTINGNTLSLNVGRRAPLAVFEAVALE